METVTISGIKDFDLKHIFECGQCFRWNEEEDGSYTGVAMGRTVNLAYCAEKETLRIEGSDEAEFESLWKKYLDLDRDYGAVKAELAARDSVVCEAIKSGSGIRILNQDNWETLISFIISQNNNIPRIKKCIEGLCRDFGEELSEFRGKKRYAFPTFERLAAASEADLGNIKLGYRARYIVETAKAVAEDNGKKLYSLNRVSTEEAYTYLTGLCGVGPKVANCVLLFAMEKYDSFPIDVWVRRVMSSLYGIDEKDTAKMKDFAENTFGKYGGFAQQYLFYHIREKR